MSDKLCVDESMIQYFGHHPSKQFILGKPIRYGFKMWMLCSSTGACHHFELYLGAGEPRPKGVSLGESVVMNMSKHIPAGCQLYMDRFFTSLPLLKRLSFELIPASGTIQRNRLKDGQNFLTSEKNFKKEPRGTSELISCDGVCVTQWQDNKTVLVASNFVGLKPETLCRRFSRKEHKEVHVKQPKAIHMYNKFMGGVDALDQSISTYRTHIRIRKWYWPIFTWLLDLCCVNSWYLMRQHANDAGQLLNFRRSLVLSFLSRDVKISRVPAKGPACHVIKKDETLRRLRCKVCHSQTWYRCSSCEIALHPNECFELYHK